MGFDDNNRSVGSLSRGYEDIVAVIRAGVGTEVAVDRPPRIDGRKEPAPIMTAWCALKAKKRHGKRVRAPARPAALVDGVKADSDKARVMAYFRGLVADGLAEWQTLDDGTIRLCLGSGETYLLRKTTVTRIA